MSSKTASEYIPGMAYERIMKANFMTAKGKNLKELSDAAKAARSALKDAEKHRKGRGYRYLVTVDNPAAVYLCEWFQNFLASDDYSNLTTAQALAMRTVADRFCTFARVSTEHESQRRTAIQRRVARMQEGRQRKREAQEQEQRDAERQEALDTIPRLESDLNKWTKEYEAALTAAGKARSIEKAGQHYDKCDRLQASILQGQARLRKLKNLVA